MFSVFVPAALLLQLFVLPARAEVYLTKEEALELVLGKDTVHRYDRRAVPPEMQEDLRRQGLLSGSMQSAHFFIAETPESVLGYALIDQEVGKHLPITYIVGISPQGSVTRVEMMVFREVRGWEARERRFMRQFETRSLHEDLRIGPKLKGVSGATLSSQAIARGVARALFLWGKFYSAETEKIKALQ